MQGKTHIIGGVAAGLLVTKYAELNPLITVGAATIGALLPDIDHGQSKLSRSNPILTLLSSLVNVFFTHRTFTHSLVFLGLMWWLLATWVPLILYGFIAGMASHLLLDAVTKNGIKLFWPLPVTFRIPLYIRTGGAVENIVAVLLMLGIVYLLADLVYPF